jgi:transcription termination factor Rho
LSEKTIIFEVMADDTNEHPALLREPDEEKSKPRRTKSVSRKAVKKTGPRKTKKNAEDANGEHIERPTQAAAETASATAEPQVKEAEAQQSEPAIETYRPGEDQAIAQQVSGGNNAVQTAPPERATEPSPAVEVARSYEPVFGEGLVEVSGKGFGFLRDPKRNYVQSPQDIFVTPEVVRKHALRDGLWIKGEIRRGGRGPQLFKLVLINGEDPEQYRNLPVFEELTSINPLERIRLETVPDRFTTRVMDLMTPIGKGQRGLIVAPPRTGKTTLLQHIGSAVVKNHPEMKLIILLVDERPEEVTEIRRTVPEADIMASSNDSDIKSHTRIAQLAIERARRLVEAGKDVFVLMDSLTRIGRAFNNATAGGGRTMSGGMDSRAMEIPRKLFAAARNTEEAGSLTIMATALIETGSRMDELIFQEFKGTGNMEMVLDRQISDQRVFPAIDIFKSGTRREELLLPAHDLDKINTIRRGLAGHRPPEAIERLLSFLKKFPTNAQMLREIPG